MVMVTVKQKNGKVMKGDVLTKTVERKGKKISHLKKRVCAGAHTRVCVSQLISLERKVALHFGAGGKCSSPVN